MTMTTISNSGARIPWRYRQPYTPQSPYQQSTGVQAPQAYQPTPQVSFSQAPYPGTPETQPAATNVQPWQWQQAQRQQTAFGPALSSILPWQQGPILRKDIPLMQVGLQYQTQMQSELDRQRAYEELMRSWYGLGQSPESQLAKQTATERLQAGGPWTPELLEQQRGAIRNAGGIAQQAAQRQLASALGERGLGSSSIAGMQQAQLAQQAGLNIQQQLSGLEMQARLQNEEAQRLALGQLQEMAAQEQSQRTALDAAIANLFASTEREPLDLAPLAELIQYPHRQIGGMK